MRVRSGTSNSESRSEVVSKGGCMSAGMNGRDGKGFGVAGAVVLLAGYVVGDVCSDLNKGHRDGDVVAKNALDRQPIPGDLQGATLPGIPEATMRQLAHANTPPHRDILDPANCPSLYKPLLAEWLKQQIEELKSVPGNPIPQPAEYVEQGKDKILACCFRTTAPEDLYFARMVQKDGYQETEEVLIPAAFEHPTRIVSEIAEGHRLPLITFYEAKFNQLQNAAKPIDPVEASPSAD